MAATKVLIAIYVQDIYVGIGKCVHIVHILYCALLAWKITTQKKNQIARNEELLETTEFGSVNF